jgi:hypothetical protein
VNYSVSANTTTSQRVGTIAVAGQTFTLTQDGQPACTYAISPATVSYDAAAHAGSIAVTCAAGCGWWAASNASWITITSSDTGYGNRTVTYSVAANTSTSARTGTIAAAGQTFTITQQGQSCTYAISPTGSSPAASATTGSVNVTCGTSCPWTAASNVSWITITSSATGNGGGTVSYAVSANTSTSPRTGTLTIAGQTFTMTQAGKSNRVISVSPRSIDFGKVRVRTFATKTVTVSNTGTANLTVSGIALSGTNADQFRRTTKCRTVAPKGSCSIQVIFAPTFKGNKSATLSISSDDPNTPVAGVALAGTGR